MFVILSVYILTVYFCCGHGQPWYCRGHHNSTSAYVYPLLLWAWQPQAARPTAKNLLRTAAGGEESEELHYSKIRRLSRCQAKQAISSPSHQNWNTWHLKNA